MAELSHPARFQFRAEPGAPALISFEGDWRIHANIPSFSSLVQQIRKSRPLAGIDFDTRALKSWDSAYLAFLLRIRQYCVSEKIPFKVEGLPEGARRMIVLAMTVPERAGARRDRGREGHLAMIGQRTVAVFDEVRSALEFLGDIVVSTGRFVTGRARFP